MKQYLRKIDQNTVGNRYDVSPLFSDFESFNTLIDDLLKDISGTTIDLVAGIDALGFVLGTAIALKLGVGLLVVRKGDKLPCEVNTIDFQDYTAQAKQLEIRKDILAKGMRVLIVDDWIETGSQVSSVITLIEGQGAIVAGIAAINMDSNELTNSLRSEYDAYTVME